jgi:hypothetical protein
MNILTRDTLSRFKMHLSQAHDAVIRVYDAAGNLVETHEHAGKFREP